MTEQEWFLCKEPKEMVQFLIDLDCSSRPSRRKMILLSIALLKSNKEWMEYRILSDDSNQSRHITELKQILETNKIVGPLWANFKPDGFQIAACLINWNVLYWMKDKQVIANLVRHIIGNPFKIKS